MRILTVDDSVTMQDMITETLIAGGHDVIRAGDGRKALEILSVQDVELIISDVNMINMGGFEFVSRVRALPQYQFTPILFLTTENSDELRRIGREIGATGWLTKPFDPVELNRTISRVAA